MCDKNTFFNSKTTLNAAGKLIDLSLPRVMGILNITPDSFFDGGRHDVPDKALQQVGRMLEEGATFIDIGAYSSRPDAADIPESEELQRLLPVIQAIVREFPEAIISVDTFRSAVARAAIGEGAHIINDISAGELDKDMFDTMANLNVPYIMMHMRGTPKTMQTLTDYDDLVGEMIAYFSAKVQRLKELGVPDVIIDPGFGFAKTLKDNYRLLNAMEQLKVLELPVLAGLSRKSMLYKLLNITPQEALNATTAANTIALLKGASILRVHDVKEAVECIQIVSVTTSTVLPFTSG
ncbi:dihydropteroate synthase [Pedobacter sp. BS3]|uniref:dihydropteroate synthase n=1 Tax=Pedobacter sp. BS3 TaxID=2567937 RepID=UPI0011ECE29C|nr:dihydropteroate synthase [Pedobacter sp. BS3]TZF81694.1 dihydropteroate synthase [Pedobacter sp. BS3]